MNILHQIGYCILFILFIGCKKQTQNNGLISLEYDFNKLENVSIWDLFEIDQVIELNLDATGHYVYPVSKIFLAEDDSTFIVYSRDIYQKLVYVYRGGPRYESINRWGGYDGIYDFSGVTDCQVYNDSIYLLDYLKNKVRIYDLNMVEGRSILLPYSYRSFNLLGGKTVVFDTDGLSNGSNDDHEVAILSRTTGSLLSFLTVNSNPYLQMGIESERYSNTIGDKCYYVRQYDPCIYQIDGNLESISAQFCITFHPDRFISIKTEDDLNNLARSVSEESGIFRYFCPIQSQKGFGIFISNSTIFEKYFLWIQGNDIVGFNIVEKDLLGNLPLNAVWGSRFAAFLEQDNTKARNLLSDKVELNDKKDYVIIYRLGAKFSN
ncbi:MAG: 6-bladed beta-propeller [Saprospiraceae bacterium]|nr:6-bladed beta-propeller [Saprospiraceae bacterium]